MAVLGVESKQEDAIMSNEQPIPLERALEWAFFELRDRGLVQPYEQYSLTLERLEQIVKAHPEVLPILNRVTDMSHSTEAELMGGLTKRELQEREDYLAHLERMKDPEHRFEEEAEWAANHPPYDDDL